MCQVCTIHETYDFLTVLLLHTDRYPHSESHQGCLLIRSYM